MLSDVDMSFIERSSVYNWFASRPAAPNNTWHAFVPMSFVHLIMHVGGLIVKWRSPISIVEESILASSRPRSAFGFSVHRGLWEYSQCVQRTRTISKTCNFVFNTSHRIPPSTALYALPSLIRRRPRRRRNNTPMTWATTWVPHSSNANDSATLNMAANRSDIRAENGTILSSSMCLTGFGGFIRTSRLNNVRVTMANTSHPKSSVNNIHNSDKRVAHHLSMCVFCMVGQC